MSNHQRGSQEKKKLLSCGVDRSLNYRALCTTASLGDASFSATAYAVLAFRHQDATWVRVRDGRDVLLIIAAGLLTSVVGESMGCILGWWSSSPLLPLILGLELGTPPLVQLAVLDIFTFELLRAVKLRNSVQRPYGAGDASGTWLRR